MSQVNISVEEFADQNRALIGSGSDAVCSYDVINKARMIAYPMGDWVGTMDYRPIYVSNGIFTLPYDLETVKSAKYFSGRSININSVISKDDYNSCNCSVFYRIDGRSFSPFQLTEKAPFIFWGVNKGDVGTEVRVIYRDWSGTMHDETLVLQHGRPNCTRLTEYPAVIHRISKPTTRGMVAVSCGDQIGYIHPEEKFPTYTVYCADLPCNGAAYVVVYAKKKFLPYSILDKQQVLDIHPEALSSLIIAVKAKSKRDPQWANEYKIAVSLAREFLNKESENENTIMRGMFPVELSDSYSDLTDFNNNTY